METLVGILTLLVALLVAGLGISLVLGLLFFAWFGGTIWNVFGKTRFK